MGQSIDASLTTWYRERSFRPYNVMSDKSDKLDPRYVSVNLEDDVGGTVRLYPEYINHQMDLANFFLDEKSH